MEALTDVWCLGEALIDVVDSGGRTTEFVGGSVLNVACGLAALGHDTTLACWVADDARGRRIVDHAAAHGVRLADGSTGAERTPVALAQLDAAGHATYRFDLAWDLPDLSDLAAAAHVHTGSIAATLEPGGSKVVAAVRSLGDATVSYDPNARPSLMGSPEDVVPRVEELVALSDVVKASDEDLAWLFPGRPWADTARAWADAGPRLVVVTRGGEGASAFLSGDASEHRVPPATGPVRDTVGAGDSFMAGLLSGLLDLGLLGGADARARLAVAGWDAVRPALQRASATAGLTVGRAGAYSPPRAEVDAAAPRP